MCEIVDIGYKASEKCYIYDCVPLYNPALQGLFLCRDGDLRKSRFLVGDGVRAVGHGQGRLSVLDVRYWSGRFCYRIAKGEGKEEEVEEVVELLLEEVELVKMVEGRCRENERPGGASDGKTEPL